MYRGGGVIDLGLIPEKAKDFTDSCSFPFISVCCFDWFVYPLPSSQIVVPEWQFLAPQGEVVIAWCNHLPLLLHNNKFATKKRSTATTYKEMAKTTFCRGSQQERKFAKHDPEPQFTNKMLSRPTRCRRNVVFFEREMFWKFGKRKIQIKLSGRTICKKVIKNDHLQKMIKINKFKTRNIKKIDAKFVLFT